MISITSSVAFLLFLHFHFFICLPLSNWTTAVCISVIEIVFIVTIFPLLQDEGFPVQRNCLRDLNPSCKTDLDLLDYFGRENSILP